MHRSGTSLLTGSLEAAGLHLGDVNHAARFNRKGNKENESIRRFHNGLLRKSRAAWHRPPNRQIEWNEADEGRARSLIEPYLRSDRPWGFKDPRTIWTVEGWLRLLPGARLIGVFRHPSLVVHSLVARHLNTVIEPDEALRLWYAYNSELVRLQRRYRFPLVQFSSGAALHEDFIAPLTSFARSLGLAGPLDRFFDRALVHQTKPGPVRGIRARILYRRLIAGSRSGTGSGATRATQGSS